MKIDFFTVKSPFERAARLDALAAFAPSPTTSSAGTRQKTSAGEGSSRHHRTLKGLLGSARALAIGAVARLRAQAFEDQDHSQAPLSLLPPSVVLAIVENPDTADDLLGDLRAFRASEEALSASTPAPIRKEEAAPKLPPEDWEDHTKEVPASLPGNLLDRLPLESLIFPAWDVLPTESERPEGAALAGRQRTLDRLRALRLGSPSASDATAPLASTSPYAGLPHALVVAAPIVAVMQPCESPDESGGRIVLRSGQTQDPIKLGRKLADIGFDRTGQVEVKGEYALRGGILDIFPYASETPYRVDFFDDQIESISPFDPLTQRSEAAVDVMEIADASITRLRKLFSPKSAKSKKPSTILDHLPDDALIVWVDPTRIAKRAELFLASLVSGKSACLSVAQLRKSTLKRFDSLTLVPQAMDKSAEKSKDDAQPFTEAELNFVPGETDHEADGILDEAQDTEVKCTSLQRLQGDIGTHAMEWKKLAASRMAVLVFCETQGGLRQIESMLKDAKVLPAPSIKLIHGKIETGFDLRSAGLAALSDGEILQKRKHARATAKKQKHVAPADARPLASIFELQLGDYVVHAGHGIARYLGINRLEKSGRLEDYLTLQFDDAVKLYVPATHIHLVSKFVGGTANLKLSRLGTKSWVRKKERAQKAIKDLAEDLLAIQSVRQSLPGIVYPPDDDWQHEFESTFPFEETVDQVTSIAAIKSDMESTCPMDRLLCGDVGFGKTEVAIRAAFKTVSSGRQFGVLVPTTLLCEQHGRTFKERFAGYPISVETLSRFKSKKEQREVLEKLADGRLDGVIGTHRVIQKDVIFKNLGLAIIDEEQRFGVEHKEFFKQLRKSIDVLTLTATPIPRTLHMALLGLRDISNLTTAPQNRRPIATKVARASEDLFRRAILRELSRGGQCFVVHPRVLDIEELRGWLAEIVPEARFGVGHGQMSSDELETVMARFLEGEMDVLVSTTIVESGLDIPRANTILIHEADRFGLAELHQLRGRVGRSDIQAYCYMLLPLRRSVTPDGLRRLRALEEFDDLGAGFQIALKDLEIRGAGNVLGGEQSGWIAEIGYDLYCKLLDATVQELKGMPPPGDQIEVSLHLRGGAYVPESYVQDEKAVLECYRRIEKIEKNDDIERLRAEMTERFGPLPKEAHRLFEEIKLRLLAKVARIPYIAFDKEEQRLIFKFHGWDMKAIDRAIRGMHEARDIRVIDEQTLSFGLMLKAKHDESALRKQVRYLLEPLADRREKLGSRVN